MGTAHDSREQHDIRQQVRVEQVRAHYAQIPAMVIAPMLGGLFTAWVLWDAADSRLLVAGLALLMLLSAARLLLRRLYFAQDPARADARLWRVLAVGAALLSGCLWGSAAPLLFPPQQREYELFLIVLLTLLPVVPIAALAVYLPAFYAYTVPCLAPFVIVLALHDSHAARMAALLLVMMMAAMTTFAHRYSRSLSEAIALRVQLARKSDALQAAIEHKSRFIAAASHDLRQPVHAMGLFLELLRSTRGAAREQCIDWLEASQRSLRHMLANILDLSKLEAQAVEPRLHSVELAGLLRRLSAEFAPLAAARALRWRCRALPVFVHTDAALLERMLRNLLSNALKFTHRGGVLIACRRRGGKVLVQVYDTGIGIGGGQAEAVFGEFHRGREAIGLEAEGLGLGLAIVRQTSALLGHAVLMRSVPGRGSMFGIELPSASDGAAGALSEPTRAAPAVMPAVRVLIVDDDRAVRTGLELLLRQWGHHATACGSAEDAMAALAAGHCNPDLIVLDFRLGRGTSGLQLADAIAQRLQRRVPVILITGDTAPDRIREAIAAGHVLLHKPVDPQRLRLCMAEAWLAGSMQAAAASATAVEQPVAAGTHDRLGAVARTHETKDV